MRTSTWLAALVTFTILAVSGCVTTPIEAPLPAADLVASAANDISSQGGISAIGVCTTRTIEMATMRSKERGRVDLAAAIEARVDALKQQFNEEVKTPPTAATDSYFTAVAKAVSARAIHAAVPEEVKHETIADSTTVWSLFVQDPKSLLAAFTCEGTTYRAVHARFQASQAYLALQADIEHFPAFKAGRSRALRDQQ